MKKRVLSVIAMAMACVMALGACSSSTAETTAAATEAAETEAAAEAEETTVAEAEATEAVDSEAADSIHVLVQGLDAIKEKGKIVIGMTAAVPPYTFHHVEDGKDEIVGSEIELIKKIAEALGVDYELNDMEFDGLLMALQAGKIDMVVSTMSPTAERAENVDFSDVYYECDYYIVVNQDDKDVITTAEDLTDKVIGVQKNSTMEIMVAEQIPQASSKGLARAADLSIDLANKKVDAILVDVDTAKLMCKANPSLYMTDIRYEATGDALGAAIAMPKGTDPEVMQTINDVIAEVKDSGQMQQWVDEYIEIVDTY